MVQLLETKFHIWIYNWWNPLVFKMTDSNISNSDLLYLVHCNSRLYHEILTKTPIMHLSCINNHIIVLQLKVLVNLLFSMYLQGWRLVLCMVISMLYKLMLGQIHLNSKNWELIHLILYIIHIIQWLVELNSQNKLQ